MSTTKEKAKTNMNTGFKWTIRFLFVDGWPNIFALIALAFLGAMLVKGGLSVQTQTRLEDMIGIIIGYYFFSNPKAAKTTDTIQTMAETQKHLATNATPDNQVKEDVIKSGDPVTVIKKDKEE